MDPKQKAWRQRVGNRLVNALRAAGRISLRELQRRTNYNRRAVGIAEPVSQWFEILEILAKQKRVRFENSDGKPLDLWEAECRDRVWIVWQPKTE